MSAAVVRVTLPFSEAGFAPKTFASLADANAFLHSVTPPTLGYYKTDFVVTFADGFAHARSTLRMAPSLLQRPSAKKKA